LHNFSILFMVSLLFIFRCDAARSFKPIIVYSNIVPSLRLLRGCLRCQSWCKFFSFSSYLISSWHPWNTDFFSRVIPCTKVVRYFMLLYVPLSDFMCVFFRFWFDDFLSWKGIQNVIHIWCDWGDHTIQWFMYFPNRSDLDFCTCNHKTYLYMKFTI
jgi:hypothetical protein